MQARQTKCQSQPCTCVKNTHTHYLLHTAKPRWMYEAMHRPCPMLTGYWNTLHWRTRTVNISVDGPAMNRVCSYLDKCTGLTVSNTLSSNPSLLQWRQLTVYVWWEELSIKNNHEISTFLIITRLLPWILLSSFLKKKVEEKTTTDTIKQTGEQEAGLAVV